MRADSECRSCHAPVRWAVHETTGRRMPLDCEPVPDGKVVVVEWHDTNPDTGARYTYPLPIVGVGKKAITRAASEYRYTSHFATCPNAARHRKS